MAKVKTKPKESEYWAIGLFYEPFRLGCPGINGHRPCEVPKRFKVLGKPIKVGKYPSFVTFDPVARDYKIYHIKSGGLLGSGKSLPGATACAKKNIKITPDLDAQMEIMGPVEKHDEIDTGKARKMLARDKS